MNRSMFSADGCRLLLLLALSSALVSCRDTRLVSYRIPKEKGAALPAQSAAPAVTVAERPVGELVWRVPTAWRPKAPSSMRRASYEVGEGPGPFADLAVTAFPGVVGGDLANINRWRGQLDLPPIAEADLAEALQSLSTGGLAIRVADLTGGSADNPQRMLGAIVPYGGATWFFKLTGPAAVVGAEQPRFMAFLATLAPVGPGQPAAAVAPPSEAITASAAVPDLHWAAPAHWATQPAAALRKATFIIPGPTGTSAELAVTAFPGAVGGELANVNRWRGQLQLPPLDEAGLAGTVTRLTVHGLPVAVVEFGGGPGGSKRLVGAMVPHAGATWFFKLTGDDVAVATVKSEFLSFLQTLSAP